MFSDILFYLIFLSQIFLLSWYFPRKIRSRVEYVFENYPPSKYPNLYPRPLEKYQRGLWTYWNTNIFIMIISLGLFFVLVNRPDNGEWSTAIVVATFFLQFVPMLMLEVSVFKYYKLMRENRTRTLRTAPLQPRRLFDFISPGLLSLVILLYLAFIALVVYVQQFGYPWFGGYANVAILTLANLFFAALAYWHMFGKKLDPYQSHEDRMNQSRLVVKQMALVSIAVTIYVSFNIILSSFELRHLQPMFLSVYFQLLAFISYQTVQIENIDFDVYKEEPLAT